MKRKSGPKASHYPRRNTGRQNLADGHQLPIYYWSAEKATAEIDFLIQYQNRIIPICPYMLAGLLLNKNDWWDAVKCVF